jgi:transcription elongation factor GreA
VSELNELVITKDGFERLSEELGRLKGEGRSSVADRLRDAAASEANLCQNAEYFEARQEQAQLERRIALLEDRLRSARIVPPRLGNGRVDLGERVRVRDLVSRRPLEVELVGPLEADLAAGRVSVASPLGQALVGRREGEIAEVEAPRGRLGFEVLAVELPTRAA